MQFRSLYIIISSDPLYQRQIQAVGKEFVFGIHTEAVFKDSCALHRRLTFVGDLLAFQRDLLGTVFVKVGDDRLHLLAEHHLVGFVSAITLVDKHHLYSNLFGR
jgi:hypothetical protein